MKNKSLWRAGALLAGLVWAQHASAWYGGTFSWDDPAGGYAEWSRAQMYQQTIDYNKKLAQGGSSSKKSSGKKTPKKPALNPSAYEFTPSAAVSAAVMEDFLNDLYAHAEKNGADAETLNDIRAMRNWDAMNVMRDRLKAGGLNPDSLATAMMIWLHTNYHAIHESEGTELPKSGLLTQLQVAMSQDKNTLAMTNEQKQRAAEAMLWMTFVQIYAQAKLEGDPAGRHEAAQLARKSLLDGGIDPDLMHITRNGLEVK